MSTTTELVLLGFRRGARAALLGLDEMDRLVPPEAVFPSGPCQSLPIHAVHALVREYITLALGAVPQGQQEG